MRKGIRFLSSVRQYSFKNIFKNKETSIQYVLLIQKPRICSTYKITLKHSNPTVKYGNTIYSRLAGMFAWLLGIPTSYHQINSSLAARAKAYNPFHPLPAPISQVIPMHFIKPENMITF